MNRAERRRQEKAAAKAGAMMAGPYHAPEGATNADALAAIVEELGGPPERGELYRVGVRQGFEGRKVQFVGEYIGLAEDRISGHPEHALRFVIRNPTLPATLQGATADNPAVFWPLDIWHLQPAQPGDLDTPMHYGTEGEPTHRTPGRSRVQ